MTDSSNQNPPNLPPWKRPLSNQLASALHLQRNLHIVPRVSYDRRFAKKPSQWFRIAQFVVPLVATLFGVTFACIGIARATQAVSVPDPTFAERRSSRHAALQALVAKKESATTK
jgi:hypothetical protein